MFLFSFSETLKFKKVLLSFLGLESSISWNITNNSRVSFFIVQAGKVTSWNTRDFLGVSEILESSVSRSIRKAFLWENIYIYKN